MRWSQLHVPTLREDPADAEAASHRLLVRAGFIRQLMAGHYALLPLAVRVRAKIMQIIREEMAAIGAQEFLLPAMHPADVWRRSGRWELMGEEMFRLRDRKGADLALGMTHEEIFALTAAELRSYRDLPQAWYQFQTKFRDEPRPKSGLIRVREFTMKDSYSFDLDAGRPGPLLRRATTAPTSASSPGSASRRSPSRRPTAPWAAPTRSSSCARPTPARTSCCAARPAGTPPTRRRRCRAWPRWPTARCWTLPSGSTRPGVRTIEDLAVGYGVPADQQIKTLVYVVDGSLTLVLLRGDHDLMEQKLIDATGTTAVRPAQPDEIRSALGALPGSLGAVGVTELPVLADEALRGRTGMTTGANTDDVHLRGVVGRARHRGGPVGRLPAGAAPVSPARAATVHWRRFARSRSGTSSSSAPSSPRRSA